MRMVVVPERLAALGALGALVLLGAGCSGNSAAQTFGFGKRSPDEFQVVKRQPLVVPPELRLRPPVPGAEGPASTAASTEAYTVLTGNAPTRSTGMSAAEVALLDAAPGRELPNIRQVLAQEDPQTTVLDRGRFLFILSWQRPRDAGQGPVIDPAVESQRLRGEGIVTTTRTASTPIVTR